MRSSNNIKQLINRFKLVTDHQELLVVVNMMIDKENAKNNSEIPHLSLGRISILINDPDSFYDNFEIPKKSGGVRSIDAPREDLKHLQRSIYQLLDLMFTPHDAAHGFIEERSVITNAASHVSKDYVLNIDLKDFFPSITKERIMNALQLEPFELNDYLVSTVAKLTTYEGILPQGAPSSPLLTNIIALPLDKQLEDFAAEKGITYSRYVDDITFSSDEYVYDPLLINEINSVISNNGFKLNWKKFRLQKYYHRQEVTGIIVNEKLNNQRQFIRKIRAMLHNWEHKGLDQCQNEMAAKYYPHEKAYIKYGGNVPDFRNVLKGYIMFMGMVRGKSDKKYQSFISKFELLNN